MPSQKRVEYTMSDKLAILNYIIQEKCYYNLRGNRMWQALALKKTIPHTWQSLREHFKKQIITCIHTFDIPQKEIQLIKKGWKDSENIRTKNNEKIKRIKSDITDLFSDEDCTSEGKISNVFSDEEDEPTIKPKVKEVKTQSSDSNSTTSLDLLEIDDRILPEDIECTTSKKEVQNKLNDLMISDELNKSLIIISDSDDEVFTELNTLQVQNEYKDELFTTEDINLLKIFQINKTMLKKMKDLNIYKFHKEVYSTSRTPEELRHRFIHFIYPNIEKYSNISKEEMIKLYEDKGINVPDNLHLLKLKSDLNLSQSTNENNQNVSGLFNKKIAKHDISTNVCEHEITPLTDYDFCRVILNNELHIYFTVNRKSKECKINDRLFRRLSKVFNVKSSCLHYIKHFKSLVCIEQLINYRNFLNRKIRHLKLEFLKGNIDDTNTADFEEILTDLRKISLYLECNKNCNNPDLESQETVNTQNFCPLNQSTPRSTNLDNVEINKTNEELSSHSLTQEVIDIESDNVIEQPSTSFSNQNMNNNAMQENSYEINLEIDSNIQSNKTDNNVNGVFSDNTSYITKVEDVYEIKLNPNLFSSTNENLNKSEQNLPGEINLNNIKVEKDIEDIWFAPVLLVQNQDNLQNFDLEEESSEFEKNCGKIVNIENFDSKEVTLSCKQIVKPYSNEYGEKSCNNENSADILFQQTVNIENSDPLTVTIPVELNSDTNVGNNISLDKNDLSICPSTIFSDHNYSIKSKEISIQPEITININENEATRNITIENDSQYLESVPTQSSEFKSAITNMYNEQTESNETFILPCSSEAYHTALSQDIISDKEV